MAVPLFSLAYSSCSSPSLLVTPLTLPLFVWKFHLTFSPHGYWLLSSLLANERNIYSQYARRLFHSRPLIISHSCLHHVLIQSYWTRKIKYFWETGFSFKLNIFNLAISQNWTVKDCQRYHSSRLLDSVNVWEIRPAGSGLVGLRIHVINTI